MTLTPEDRNKLSGQSLEEILPWGQAGHGDKNEVKVSLNVYQINGYWIAAPCKMDAYYIFLNEEDNLEYPFSDENDLDENEEDGFIVSIRRITNRELNNKDIPCCTDGCEDCQENDYTYYSLKDLLESKDNLKCVLAKEED